MRWPLRNQILAPMGVLMLVALIGVSVLNASLSVRRTRQRIERDLAQVTRTLATSNFPLTDGILRQMRGLTGAEFVLMNRQGDVVAASSEHAEYRALPRETPPAQAPASPLASSIEIEGESYFHKAVDLAQFGRRAAPQTLHILYPEESYLHAWREVVYPPAIVSGVAIVLAIGLSLAIASRVARPLRQLQVQVEEIAQGNFQSLPEPHRNDEVADLSRSINRMAKMLAQYEKEVRRAEKLRTLGQLGSGIAHQIRNAVTGCRLAVEFHQRGCRHDTESLEVANRQLELMERYLRRFLSLGRSEDNSHDRIELAPVVSKVSSLVRPAARHLGVVLECEICDEPCAIEGDQDALEQLLINLVLNGIEAASQRGDRGASGRDEGPPRESSFDPMKPAESAAAPRVRVLLRRVGGFASLEIRDSGSGPASDIADSMFEPFVTGKREGAGLGLSVAREIAAAHGGAIGWRRHEGITSFKVDLPLEGPASAKD